MPRFYARSASDKTDDWPFWFVADEMQGGLNVTKRLQNLRGDAPVDIRGLGVLPAAFALQPFMDDYATLKLAHWANTVIGDAPTGMWEARASA
jgi:hypothetical protein